MKDGEWFFQMMEDIKRNFDSINRKKIRLGILLNEIENAYKIHQISEGFGTFKMLLATFGVSYSQVKAMINSAKWIKAQGYELADIDGIPITKLNLMHSLKVEKNDDLLFDLMELSYTALKEKYEK